MTELEALWEPIDIGPVSIANRIFVSAHQTHYAVVEDNLIGDRYIAYMRERARGGAGLLVAEAGAVHPSTEKVGLIDLFRERIVPGLTRLADAVHAFDVPIFAQLSHLGSQDLGTSRLDAWHPVVGPSALPSPVYGRVAKPIGDDEIASIVAGYGDAAANAAAAGIDGLELSAGHGYLLHQFLSPLTNKRDDAYGGSTAGRCRLLLEIAAAIRGRLGHDLPLGIRLSYDEFIGDSGITAQASDEIVRHLHRAGAFDYFSITAGNYHTIHQWVPSATGERDGHLAAFAARARAAVGGEVPVMVASAIRTIERASEIVARGEADLVAMTRAHIADPEIVAKVRSGRAAEIRRCVGANQGCLRRAFENQGITCTVNPAAGREALLGRDALMPTRNPRRVVVIGGGPAGMKLAETAAVRGHSVVLVERGERLGGQLLAAGRLPGRHTWLELATDLATALARLGVEVHLETEATAELVVALGADELFVASGSSFEKSGYSISVPWRDSIPGVETCHVLEPIETIDDTGRCGDRVAIVDDNGDYVSLGLALMLGEQGRSVEVITGQAQPGARLQRTGDLPWLRPRLAEAGVRVRAHSIAIAIEPEAVRIRDTWSGEERTVAADTVVLNQMRTSDPLPAVLEAGGLRLNALGDCVSPREVDDAIFEGMASGAGLP